MWNFFLLSLDKQKLILYNIGIECAKSHEKTLKWCIEVDVCFRF